MTLGVLSCALLLSTTAHAQQVADTAFAPSITRPAFAVGAGPLVVVDEAHHNFHTADGRYQPFAALLRRDGFTVQGGRATWSDDALRAARVLVVANAVHASNEQDWKLPNPSAFEPAEIAAVRRWVEAGGSLLLIADHMPFAGAAEALGQAFGIEWHDGFAMMNGKPSGPFVFTAAGPHVLGRHAVTDGRAPDERITSVASFTGSAFRAPGATPILTLAPGVLSLKPQVAWEFDGKTARRDVGGWLQGAVLEVGKGRVAVFGEAAMFSAQLAGAERTPMGMNAPIAPQNPQFLLNVVRWLARAR
ncbi:MAG TPA: DUF4350 domain-containing protein [Luteitalea sp.]|nr:DUF4350 domain-containing protein [Luteitalea sp.]